MKRNLSILKKDQMHIDKFVKVKEAAKILGKTRGTVYNRMRSGLLDVVILCQGTDAEEKLFYREQVERLKGDDLL